MVSGEWTCSSQKMCWSSKWRAGLWRVWILRVGKNSGVFVTWKGTMFKRKGDHLPTSTFWGWDVSFRGPSRQLLEVQHHFCGANWPFCFLNMNFCWMALPGVIPFKGVPKPKKTHILILVVFTQKLPGSREVWIRSIFLVPKKGSPRFFLMPMLFLCPRLHSFLQTTKAMLVYRSPSPPSTNIGFITSKKGWQNLGFSKGRV